MAFGGWMPLRCTYILNRTNQLRLGPIGLYPTSMHRVTFLAISGCHHERGPCMCLLSSLHLRRINDSRRRRRAWATEHHRGTVGRLSAIEVASILNFSILVEHSPLIVRERVDFVSAYWISW